MSKPEKTEEKASETEKTEETPTETEEKIEGEKDEVTEATAEEEMEKLPEEGVEKSEEKPEETALEEEAKKGVEEEEIEKPKREKKEPEEDIVEEKFYTIPLRRAWIMAPRKRAPRAMRIIRSFVEKHMKIGVQKTEEEESEEEKEERLIISAELNEKIWARGIQKPPRKIKVRVVKDSEGTVTIYPSEGD